MTTFPDPTSLAAARHLIALSLQEDLGDRGDLTCDATIPPHLSASVNLVSRETGVVAGLPFAEQVFEQLGGRVSVHNRVSDGDSIAPKQVLATYSGPVKTLLTGERTVLNLLTHLSGIASRTSEFVRLVQGTKAVILDTRKTLPGYRALQKYAVRCGGGTNHRMGLSDGMLIKDNHLAARGDRDCAAAVKEARNWLREHSLSISIEIEVDTLEQLRTALRERPEIVLLDNMTPGQLREAVAIRDREAPQTLLEASGGVTLSTVRGIAETGVDRISVGSLTHSSPALDLGFDWPW